MWVHAVNKHGCEQQLLVNTSVNTSSSRSTGHAAAAATAAAGAVPAAATAPVPPLSPHGLTPTQLAQLLDGGAQ
eukprot:scaffold58581_cov54-Phaeocystis_antarctica.AAC.2